jgi:hypothetical protein
MLLQRFICIDKAENETVRDFRTKFKRLSQQLPRSHHLVPEFLLVIYIRVFSGQSIFLLDKKEPKDNPRSL